MGIIKLNGITYGIGGGGDANIVEVTKEEYERIEDRDRNGVTYFVKDLEIEGTVIDEELSEVSENPVQNRVIKEALDGKLDSDQLKDRYGIEEGSIPTIVSKIEEDSETLGYVKSKNFFDLSKLNSSEADKGVTFKNNGDGSVTVSTSSSGSTDDDAFFSFIDKTGSGFPAGLKVGDKFIASIFDSDKVNLNVIFSTPSGYASTIIINKNTGEQTITIPNNATGILVRLQVKDAGTVVNETVRPMLRPASITDDTYEPYKPSVDERLNEIEPSIVDFANILKNYIKTYPVVARATFTRLEGGGADGTKIDRIRTANIPVKKNDVVTITNGSLKHAVGIWKGNIGIDTNIRDDSTWQNNEIFTISDDGYICVVFAHSDTSQELTLSQFDGQVKIVNLLA